MRGGAFPLLCILLFALARPCGAAEPASAAPTELGEEPILTAGALAYRPGRGLRIGVTGLTMTPAGAEFALDNLNFFLIFDHAAWIDAPIPTPRIFLIDETQANAFATGRNPRHGVVAVTTGLLQLLTEREFRGVLAHEMAHIKNRDILVATIAATLAAAVTYIANALSFATVFGGAADEGEEGGGSAAQGLGGAPGGNADPTGCVAGTRVRRRRYRRTPGGVQDPEFFRRPEAA